MSTAAPWTCAPAPVAPSGPSGLAPLAPTLRVGTACGGPTGPWRGASVVPCLGVLLLAACGGDTATGAVPRDRTDTGRADSASGDPGGLDSAPQDTATDTDADTAACARALVVSVDGAALGDAPLAFGDSQEGAGGVGRTLAVRNDCPELVRFLGHPDDWLEGVGFALGALPPVALEPGETATLEVTWTPVVEGDATGTLALPHDGPESPLAVALLGRATAPLTLVLAGDGAHLLATRDYGLTAAHDAWSTTEAHTRALIRGICAGPGGFVAVGGNAERAWWTSPDGVAWVAHEEPGSPIGGCAWGAAGFVAFDGAPMWSADGAVWTRGTGATATHMRAIAAGAAPDGTPRFVASGDGGGLAVTRDGASWIATPRAGSVDLGRVAFGGGVFVAAGAGGVTAASADGGVSWVAGSTGGSTVQGLVWTGDGFLLGDGTSVYRSADGVAWTRVNAARPAPVAVVGAQVFGVVGTALYVSGDGGFSWQERVGSAGGLGFGAGAAVEVRR